jgi:Flp pilus assembly protein TadG
MKEYMVRIHREHRKGQHLIEFALVLPLLSTVLFGIVEIGFVFLQDHTVNSACRRACRMGAVGATDAQMKNFVQGYCANFNIPNSNIQIVVLDQNNNSQAAGTRTAGYNVRVLITHTLLFLTPVQSIFKAAGTTQIQSCSQYLIE